MTTRADETAGSVGWRRSSTDDNPSVDPILADACSRAAAFLSPRPSLPGLLSRRLLGHPQAAEEALIENLVRERRRQTRMDGSVDGSLVRTATTVVELLELDCPADHAAIIRTLGYVLSRQNQPGHFGEGCSPAAHEAKECRHALRGFFSPGPRDDDLAPVQIGTAVVTDEEIARFAASCFALGAVLRAREERRVAVRAHVESLLGLEALWDPASDRWSPDARFFALGALAAAPFEYRRDIERRLETAVANQQDDGQLPGAHQVSALDALLRHAAPAAQRAVRHGARALVHRQQADGSFGDERSTFVALKALYAATH